MDSGRLLIVIPFILAAVLALILSAAAWRRARSPGSLSFALACFSVCVWLFAAAMETTTTVQAEIITWAKVAFLGVSWLAPFWLLFVMEYAYPAGRYATRYAAGLLVVPIITVAVVMTNDLHHLFWTYYSMDSAGPEAKLIFYRGPWFWIFAGYSYALLGASAYFLVRAYRHFQRERRQQVIGLLIGMLVPWVGSLLYVSGIFGRSVVDYTPYTFSLAGLVFSWTLFRKGLFQLTPLAYEAIIENISDGFLLFDRQNRLLEVNKAARRMLGLSSDGLQRQPAKAALRDWPELLDLLRTEKTAQVEIPARGPAPSYDLEASVSDWIDWDHKAGKLIILHDITRRRQAEADLRASERLYRQLIDAAPVGILMINRQGLITFASPKIYKQYGLSAENDIIGHSPLNLIAPEYHELAKERIKHTLMGANHAHPQIYRLLRSDGSFFWGETVSTPIFGDEFSEPGMLSITHDVTNRKNLEIRLQHNLEQQTFINNLLETLYRAHDLKEALSLTMGKVGQYLNASRVTIYQDSAGGDEFSVFSDWCSAGISSRALEIPTLRYEDIPKLRRCMETQAMLVISDVNNPANDEGLQPVIDFLRVGDAASGAFFPIYTADERLYGLLEVDHCGQPKIWDGEDLDLMTVVSRIVSGAVARIQTEQAEKRQRALAESLHDSAAALNSTLNLEEVLDRILSNLERVVRGVSASIALMDEDGDIRFVRWRGYDSGGDDLMRTLRLRLEDRYTYRLMAETGEPYVIADTWKEEGWVKYEPIRWIRSFAGAPIRLKGKVVGFINLDSAEPDFFPSDLTYSLRVFADQAAAAIENARLYDSAHRRAEEMSILNRIGLTLTAGLETEQVLISLFDECRQVLPIDVFYVALYDSETGNIEMPLYYNENKTIPIPARNIHSQPSLTGEVIRQRHTMYLPDTTDPVIEKAYSVLRLGGRPTRSYVGVPLILIDQVVGVMSMQSYVPHAYTTEQIRLLETIATQAAIAVQNSRLYEQMRQMAITDTVTGLNTRRHFTSLGRSEVERALRYDRKCSVLMVDLDHFKRVNDTYGHNTGDQVLQAVADVCRQALRATDIVGRWGGEEFVIMLPEADRDGASLIAERIRRMMAERDILASRDIIRVKVSIGVATLNPECCSLETLIDSADRALYMAKQAGRNCVVCL